MVSTKFNPESVAGTVASQGSRLRTAAAKPSLLIVPSLIVATLFLIVPYLNMIYISLMTPAGPGAWVRSFTLDNYIQNLKDPFIWHVIALTIQLGILSVLISLVISYPAAYHLSRQPPRRRAILMMLVISPLLIGVVIRTYGWMIILS